MRFLIPAIIVGAMATAHSQPMPPTQPIKFTTELGSLADESGKVTMQIEGAIDTATGSVTLETMIKAERGFGLPTTLPTTAAVPVARMLNEASDALLSGQSYSQESDGVSVSVAQGRTAKVVQLKIKKTGFLETNEFKFDADNAASAARILERTPRIAEWLSEKLSAARN
jgi:hypothetical protein